MKTMASLAAIACLMLAGCVVLPNIEVYNETGRSLVLHLYHPPNAGPGRGTPYEFELRSGRHKTIYEEMMDRRLIISLGACDYDYGTAATEIAGVDKAVVVEIASDLVAHLRTRKFEQHYAGVYRDGDAPGFPIIPRKTCRN
ncbi:hypothetical protein BH10PSE5_BH10PSE5_09740 [soil metagenome]